MMSNTFFFRLFFMLHFKLAYDFETDFQVYVIDMLTVKVCAPRSHPLSAANSFFQNVLNVTY